MGRRWLGLALAAAGALLGPRAFAGGAGGAAPESSRPAALHKAGREPLEFRGPGRAAPEPDVSEVVLGWFGPADPNHPDFGEFWRGARMACEEENAAGGYHGKPFRLASAWSDSPWQAGVVGVTRLVYEQGAWAVIGGVDGATTHLAVQLALKAHFLLVSPGNTDVTADYANVPWLFSLPPSDERVAPALAEATVHDAGGSTFAVVAANDHDSHAALVAVRRALAARAETPALLVEWNPRGDAPEDLAGRLEELAPRALLVLAPARAAGRLVATLRRAGYHGAILGGPALSRNAFRRTAGAAADGVRAPARARSGAAAAAFARAYAERWGEDPDDAASWSYDAVRLVAAAVRRAGLNRPRIRDAVRELAPWAGLGGDVRWNALGRNEGAAPAIAHWSGPGLLR